MRREPDIDELLSSLRVKPDAAAREAAYKRMLTRRAELLAAETEAVRESLGDIIRIDVQNMKDTITSGVDNARELSMDELAAAAGGGGFDVCNYCGYIVYDRNDYCPGCKRQWSGKINDGK